MKSKRVVEYDTYFCDCCRQYVYNEESGDENYDIAAKTHVENLPDAWRCPKCGADKGKLRACTMLDGFIGPEAFGQTVNGK